MKNRDPPKPHILKEASSDMLAGPLIFVSIRHENSMFFQVSSGTAPGIHFFSFFPDLYRKSAILDLPWRAARAPNGGANV